MKSAFRRKKDSYYVLNTDYTKVNFFFKKKSFSPLSSLSEMIKSALLLNHFASLTPKTWASSSRSSMLTWTRGQLLLRPPSPPPSAPPGTRPYRSSWSPSKTESCLTSVAWNGIALWPDITRQVRATIATSITTKTIDRHTGGYIFF